MRRNQVLLLLFTIILATAGSLKHLPKHYKELAYISFFNAFYYYICKRYLLWEFKPKDINWRMVRAAHTFITTPLVVLSSLSKFPQTLPKQIVHVLKWTFISAYLEHVIAQQKLIRFKHGWNIYWSALIYLKMYTYSYLHTKNALLTWVLSIWSAIFFILRFKIPLKARLFKGPFFLVFKKDMPFNWTNSKLINKLYYKITKRTMNMYTGRRISQKSSNS
ncbi:hypothetical protein [Alkalihalobacterium sp. APHAB7]|uniref:hypothetical protein n=1 Tax=Alkalihalobacterium sp. APHAB7 TaxID=3402081 RepID=UPI003AAE1F96